MHMLQQISLFAMFSLLVATVPAVMGAGYAIWPSESKLALMRPLSLAGIFSGLAGCVVGLINTLKWVVVEDKPLMSPNALVAIAESLVPLAVAFASLTAAWLLVAVGMRRKG
jgi:predicted outer membrane lipoprotein